MDITPQGSFETLKDNVVSSISSYFPFDGKRHKIVLDSISVDDKLSIDDIRSQTEAKDHERTWGVPVVANLSLIDKTTGEVIDKKKTTLATIPKLTSRYGFIVGGNEYQVDHLFRLKSGVYARVQENGELESEFNLAKKLGSNFSIHLNPRTKKFSFKYGDAHLPLYPVMKAMGISDDELEKEWGSEIFSTNRFDKKNEKGLQDFFKKTNEEDLEPPKDTSDYIAYIHHFFDNTALLPDTTKATLGKPFTQVSGEVLKLAANKILGVSRGTHEPDDRDSLAFKEVVSVEDFLPEKLARNARNIKARLRQTVDHKKTLTEIVSPDLFKKPINEFFLTGGAKVIERSEQTNPVQMMAGHRKTTLFSELGGIKKEHAITDPMRVINPSHFGFLDPMHTPESERTGITLYLSANVRKNGKDLETPAYDVRSGKITYVKVPDFHQAMAVLPDQVRWVKGKPEPISSVVKVKLPGGAIEERPFKDAQYVLPSAKGMFDHTSNLIPFLPTDQGNRVSMADKQMEQAISLKHREAPLVQSKTEGAITFEKNLGTFSSTHSPVTGKIIEIKSDAIIVSDGKKKHEVHIYDHFPLNDAKGMMHSEPVVKVGDSVNQGQLIADTNFTRHGLLAIGTNLRVGYIPYKGYNYEDGIVISESAAKKLTSEHLYKKNLEVDPDNDLVDKSKWHAFAPRTASGLTREQFDAIDEDGVIKVGTKVKPGSVLVAAIAKNDVSKQGSALAALGSRYNKFFAWKDKSLTWDEDHVGEVVKVVKNPNRKGIKVYVKTEESMVVGDKLSGRHGNKGIITQIIPDHEMPFTKDSSGEAKPLEVILNPSGVPTRINVGQILETAAGKIAEKTGKPYVVNNFAGPNHDYRGQVVQDLKDNGISDEELIYDPKKPNKVMGSALVGPQYLLKLRHQVEKKLSVRGGGTTVENKALTYTLDRQPVKGGTYGGQGFGQLELYSMLGHGARHNIREMSTYKSDKQDDAFWVRIQQGFEPSAPQVPFSYKKFEALLKGAGVNIQKEGTELKLVPLTDRDIVRLAGNGKNEISKGHLTLRAKDLKEEKGGLFDPHVTGGIEGDKWSFIKIMEPMPNPMFVGNNNRPGPIPTLLGLRISDIDLIMAGKKDLNGKIGGAAIRDALAKVDVEHELQQTKEKLPTLTGQSLDRANKKLKFLAALKVLDLPPEEAYVLHYLPVIPPVFRPVTPTDRGDVNTAPINQHYKNFAILNQKLKEFDPKIFSDEHRNPLRSDLWDSLKALQAVGNYKPVYDESSGNRKLKGILETIGGAGEGDQPKDAFFQSKLIKRRQNLSIRSTIIPEPNLHIDQVGLPKNAAMELYKPFVVAQLGKWGLDPLSARKEMKDGTDFAFKALEEVVKDRPILLKRDPALHKFSVMAFQPKLIEGKAIQIHPLVTGGFNADFDGDCVLGEILVVSNKNLCHDESRKEDLMPHTGQIATYQIIDISQFPRIVESAIYKNSGTIEFDVPNDIYVPALNNGRMEICPVRKFSIHPNCEKWVVKTVNGREITCSQDASLALLDPETLQVVKMTPRNSIGKCMPVMRSLIEPDLWTHLTGTKTLSNKSIQMIDEVLTDFDSGWFIGASIGDGWVSEKTQESQRNFSGKLKARSEAQSRSVHLAYGKDGEEVAERWSSLAMSYSQNNHVYSIEQPHDFDGYASVSTKISIGSTALGLWLEPLIGKGAKNKHLPSKFLEMPEEFRRGLFCGLIDTDGSANWNQRSQFSLTFGTTSKQLAQEMKLLGLSLGLHCSETISKTNSENIFYVLPFSINPIQSAKWIKLTHELKRKAVEELHNRKDIEPGRNDFIPLPDRVRNELLEHLKGIGASKKENRNKEAFSQYVVLHRNHSTITRESVYRLWSLVCNTHVDYSIYLKRWFEIALDKSIGWDCVSEASTDGSIVEMYDITVPDAWTFTMASGAVVWDTMAGTVPLSREAVDEAKKMFPSRNLFSPTTGGVMYTPSQEAMLGLHLISKWGNKTNKSFYNGADVDKAASKDEIEHNDIIKLNGKETTLGRMRLAAWLPKGMSMRNDILHNPDFEITKKTLNQLATELAKNHGEHFANTIDALKDLGNEHAYNTAFSIGLKDLKPLKERDEILSKAHKEAAIAKKDIKDKTALDQKLVEIYSRATELIDETAKRVLAGSTNRLAIMVYSGARGKPEQLRQMLAAPMLMQDATNRTIPTPVTRSYSEGLDVGDYWLAQHGARKGTLQRVQGTAEPGAMSKDILNTTMNYLVTSEDCGTSNGVLMELNHEDVHDRFLAKPYKLKDGKTIRANTLITPEIWNRLKNSKHDKVMVRSPLKCNKGEGICAKCYGLNEAGNLHDLGVNIGILSGQALGEPAVQMAMDAFHSGGIAGSGRGAMSIGRFERLKNLLAMPKKLKNEAPLAKASGTVSEIKKDSAGGHDVFINGEKHYVPHNLPLRVSIGSEVKKGDQISEGHINPLNLLKLTDMPNVQNHLTNELYHGLYKKEGVRRRNIETVVRAITNLTKIRDPGHSDWVPGDVVPLSIVEQKNREMPTGSRQVSHEPILRSVKQLPLSTTNWMASLNYQHIPSTIQKAVSMGWKSDLHGSHPIPGVAYGAEFGNPPAEKPSHSY